jgi:hypothetical protein
MKQLIYLLMLLALIRLFWNYPILYPLKILVVFFHESSHALATLLTGGSVKELVINAQQGGHVISQGGNRFLILSAGYLGSLFWGVSIYLLSIKSDYDKIIMAILAMLIIAITVFFSRSWFSFSFGLLTGSAMVLSARFLSATMNDFLLRLIGLNSMLYVPFDIYSDTLVNSNAESDAYLLATAIGGTSGFWGMLWLIISLCVIFYCLKTSLNRPVNVK